MKPAVAVIYTDLDGTLLDGATYDWSPAAPALERCRDLGVPVVAVSSKTASEITALNRGLELNGPFVSENGGGIFFPQGLRIPDNARPTATGWRLDLGQPYGRVRDALTAMRKQLGWKIRGFGDMMANEIARRTHLDSSAAWRALQREYDEPFLVIEPADYDPDRLVRAARTRGLVVSLGGRFHHLHGGCDKGRAVELLTRWYTSISGGARPLTVALGDANNDLPMLAVVDVPILMSADSRLTAEAPQRLPKLVTTPMSGPQAWNQVVMAVLDRL